MDMDINERRRFYLQDILNEFTGRLRIWEDLSGLRANFKWGYDHYGRKTLEIVDIAEAREPPPQDAVAEAARIISEASDESVST